MRRILTAILFGVIAAARAAALGIPFTPGKGILHVGVAALVGLLLGGSKKRPVRRSGSRGYAGDAWDDSTHAERDDDDGGGDEAEDWRPSAQDMVCSQSTNRD